MNFTPENIHRFHLWGAFTVDKKTKNGVRKEYVKRPIITARRREDLAEYAWRAIKWWGDKGMTALHLQVEWLPGVRSMNYQFVTDARWWNMWRQNNKSKPLLLLRRACDDAIDTTPWQAPPYYWRTRRWDGRMCKQWDKPYTSIGAAVRNRPGDRAVLVQGNRKVTQREIAAVCEAETTAWGVPWRAVPRREVGSPFVTGFATLPEGAAPGLREVVVDGARAPGHGHEAPPDFEAPSLTHKLEVVEDAEPLFVSLQEPPRPGQRSVRVGDVLNPPPPPPGPPEHWHVLQHDHEAVQALALVAQANRWVVRRLPLQHGLDVMFACHLDDVGAVRAHLVKQDE